MSHTASSATTVARPIEVVTDDGVTKLRLALADGACIETVLLPRGRSDEGGQSLCLSTQVGCRMGCVFCATGRLGFVRQLEPREIVAQLEVVRALGHRPETLVFMGMGEPLDNFENWREAVRMLVDSRRRGAERPAALGSARRMTVSTCGHLDGMAKLGRENLRRMGVAVSLNAPDDEIRSKLMPVNRRWPMAELKRALLELPLRNGVLLVEYVLIRGQNDALEHARELAAYLSPLRALVNLLTYNPLPHDQGSDPFEPPEAAVVDAFQQTLSGLGVFVRRRASKGLGVAGGCGQLSGCASAGQGQSVT
ncbi:MAG: radical SAM protein [Polyangia bacterium]|jgi:23S rRNA (adenine2503-C2)-methyltransferase|nr:radical SAM protein [Polyangia bacterium]